MNDTLPIKIFIAYSKHDKSYLDNLLKHFSSAIRNKTIEVFYDGLIKAGEEWDKVIQEKLHTSDIILLLVSSDFMATNYCHDEEMLKAIDLHQQGKAQVIPIILRSYEYKDAPFAKLNFLPEKGTSISDYPKHDDAYVHILQKLEGSYETARQRLQAKAEMHERETAENQRQFNFLNCYTNANDAYEQKKWNEALKFYAQTLQLHQNGYTPTRDAINKKIEDCNYEIEYIDTLNRAEKYEKQEKYSEVITELQAVIKLKPELSSTLTPRIQELQIKALETKAKQTDYTETALGLSLKMQYVQGGTFNMGSNDGYDNEKPIHNVTIKDFYIGVYPVTQAQWRAVMSNNPSHFKDDNLPVECVSWDDVQLFLQNLNQQTGKHYRLPTEAEWEYAARGGKHSNDYIYAGSNKIDEVAWYIHNSDDTTHPVGQKKPNELGLYDMSGNVWEWCQDQWHENYEDAPTDGTAWVDGAFIDRVLRGGSWNCDPRNCRVADRYWASPNRIKYLFFHKDGHWDYSIGFRIAVSL